MLNPDAIEFLRIVGQAGGTETVGKTTQFHDCQFPRHGALKASHKVCAEGFRRGVRMHKQSPDLFSAGVASFRRRYGVSGNAT